MRRKVKQALLLTSIRSLCALFIFMILWGCKNGEYDTNESSFNIKYGTISKENSLKTVQNPGRGFYMENMFRADNLKSPFNQSFDYTADWINKLQNRDRTTNDQLSLIQLYIYLTPYVDKKIPDSAFEKMQKVFDDAKDKGYKFILRFAYDRDYGDTDADFNDVYGHLEQLKPFIQKNIGLIYVWQRGFIGPWGEGHNSPMSENWEGQTKLSEKELDIFTGRQITIRYPTKKNKMITQYHT